MGRRLNISFSPGVINRKLLTKSSPPGTFPFSNGTTTYWFGGAQALFQGVRSIGMQRGDVVLSLHIPVDPNWHRYWQLA